MQQDEAPAGGDDEATIFLESGADALAAAQGTADARAASTAAAAVDLARGLDDLRAAEGLAAIRDVAARGGERDVRQGAEMLGVADDLAAVSAALRAAGHDEVDRGMDLAGMSGQLAVVADIVSRMELGPLGGALGAMSARLHGHAVALLVEADGARALARAVDDAGAEAADLGAAEVAQGLAGLAGAEGIGEEGEAALAEGTARAAAGLAGLDDADRLGAAEGDLRDRGVADVVPGAGLAGGGHATPPTGGAADEGAS